MLGRAMGNTDIQYSPQPGLGGSHHLPPYNILYTSPWGPYPNDFLSRDSQMGVPKSPRLGFPRFWGVITLWEDLGLRWGLKKSCSPHRELSNGMLHAICTHGNRVNSWLLVVRSQIVNLTPGHSFGYNLCFRCPNGRCEPILDIHIPRSFHWYKELLKSISLTYAIALWRFRSPPGLQLPKWNSLGVWGFISLHPLTLPAICCATLGVATPLWPSVRMKLTLPKLGTWSPSGLLNL
jgi:hypothetical protein